MDPSGIAAGGGQAGERYRFGPVVVDAAAHTLSRDGVARSVEPKAFAVLLVLLRHPGVMVPRDDLLDAVWGHRHVTPGVLTRAIAQLRAVLDDDSHRPRYIQTQHALGYRFIGALEVAGGDAVAVDAANGSAIASAAPGDGVDVEPGQGGTDPLEADGSESRGSSRSGANDSKPPPADPNPTIPAHGPSGRPRADLSDAQASPEQAPDPAGSDPAGSDPAAPDSAPPDRVPPDPPPSLPAASAAPVPWPPVDPGEPMPFFRERRQSPQPPSRLAWVSALSALLVTALVAWAWFNRGSLPVRPAEASIAVLPFASLSSDRDDRYFAEGLAVEMHDALAGVPGLKVAAWSSAATPDREDPAAFGRRRGVAAVLDASVRREGERVRISARLSDTRSGFTLWSQTFDRGTDQVFATQTEIAREVVQALIGVLPDDDERLRRRLMPTRNVAAFDAYLRGVQALVEGGAAREAAGAHFDRALQLDDGFARAQAGLCRLQAWRFESHGDADAFDNARLACLRAENMDPSVGAVALALGDLYRVQGQLERAQDYYRRIENDPAMRPLALVGLGKLDIARGRPAQALERFDAALEARPGDAYLHAEKGYQQFLAGQLEPAIESLRRATELAPGNAYVWSTYGGLLLTADRRDEAAEAFGRSLAIEPLEMVLSNLGTLKYQDRDYAAAAGFYRRAVHLNPESYEIWGNLGDALLAGSGLAVDAGVRATYAKAAEGAAAYLALKPDDARALAAMGWYQAVLGDRAAALDHVRRAEALGEPAQDVAYYLAETFAWLGMDDEARQRLAAARGDGIPEIRITSNPLLARRAGPAVRGD